MLVKDAYIKHKGKFNVLVNWDSLKMTQKRLSDIATVLGGKRLSAILRNYAEDFKFWNHGMPDLILWNKETSVVKFSEVKSENDHLSEVQKAWLNYFSDAEIPCEVCYVNVAHEDSIDIFTKSRY